MNRFAITLLGPVGVLLASICSAAVIQHDWKTPGDGLLTYDDVNQREWLDLSESLLIQFPGSSLEGRYQSVTAELAPAGFFEGFAVANRMDVVGLVESAGVDATTSEFNINGVATLKLIELLTATRTRSNGHVQSRGFLDEVSSTTPNFPRRVEAIVDYFPPQTSFVGGAALFIGAGEDNQSETATAVMLFRHAVPEPSTHLVLIILLLNLAVIRLPKRRSTCNDSIDLRSIEKWF